MDEKFKQTHKLRPNPQRIDEEGLKNFRNSLPDTKEFAFSFEPTTNDFGMDGELQVFVNEAHTGEFFKVQLKSQAESKHSKDGTSVSIKIDLKTAYFLIEEAKTPTALIVIDNMTKKVYWHPTQTSPDARARLDRALQNFNESVKEPTITLAIPVVNELTVENYAPLYDYFKEAVTYLAQKETMKAAVNKPLGEGLKHLGELQESTLTLEGFDYSIRSHDDAPHQRTMFSMNVVGGKVVDYYPGKDFKPHHAPKIQIKAKFPADDKDGKAEEFKRMVEQGEGGTVTLAPENIDSYEVVSGGKVIDGGEKAKDGMRLTLTPSNEKRRLTLSIDNGREELLHAVDTWMAGGVLHMESVAGQPFALTTKFNIGKGNYAATFNIKVLNSNLTSVKQELRYLDFLRSRKEITFSVIDQDGFKHKMFSGGAGNKKLVNEAGYKLIMALKEIEDATGIIIPYPLPEDMTRKQLDEIYWAHRLVTGNKINKKMTVNFKLGKTPKEQLKVGGALGFYQEQPSITIFDKPYAMTGFTQEIKGIVSELTQKPDGEGGEEYSAKMDNAEIVIKRLQDKSY